MALNVLALVTDTAEEIKKIYIFYKESFVRIIFFYRYKISICNLFNLHRGSQ